MKYMQCNEFCDDQHDVHYLGRIRDGQAIDANEFLPNAGRKCCGCGGTAVPHVGFGYSCWGSSSGGHYFSEKLAEINAK